jgi:16S rRNA A1518/A1519 N6-dimethyltransferase RsmA/KsgA/DIM1 with predicted DNA glycosylase/AP lyase activity
VIGYLLLIVVVVFFIFAFVILFGAPYLPTMSPQAETAINMLRLKKGQRLLELGAGDGSVVLYALRKGLKVTAIELNPLLCVVIWIRTRRYRSSVTIKCANFWTTSWGEYDGIYVFLLDKYMTKLDKYIVQQNKNVLLASYTFQIPQKEAIKQMNGVFLYQYRRK